jgi:hypothetical protein
MNLIKKILLPLLLITSIITIYSKFLYQQPTTPNPINLTEKYNPTLSYITSISILAAEVDKKLQSDYTDTSKIVNCIDDILRDRFYHTYSEYSLKDNWVCFLAGKIFWWDLLCPVNENDILKYPMAACSQQALVFQKMLENYGISFATTNFNVNQESQGGHFACSAYYSGSWHLFDSNKEPIKVSGNPPFEKLIRDSQLVKSYPRLTSFMEGKVQYKLISRTDINQQRGREMSLFHKITHFLSSWLWLILMVFYAALTLKTI